MIRDTLDFIWEVMLPIIAVIIGIMALLFVICLPIAWFDGHAKSAYLKQIKGIDIPWYQATWLTVQINDVNAEVKTKPVPQN